MRNKWTNDNGLDWISKSSDVVFCVLSFPLYTFIGAQTHWTPGVYAVRSQKETRVTTFRKKNENAQKGNFFTAWRLSLGRREIPLIHLQRLWVYNMLFGGARKESTTIGHGVGGRRRGGGGISGSRLCVSNRVTLSTRWWTFADDLFPSEKPRKRFFIRDSADNTVYLNGKKQFFNTYNVYLSIPRNKSGQVSRFF